MIKPLLICSIKPPSQTRMIITPRQCRLIRVNDKMYELLTLDPDLDFFQVKIQNDDVLIENDNKDNNN